MESRIGSLSSDILILSILGEYFDLSILFNKSFDFLIEILQASKSLFLYLFTEAFIFLG